MHNLTLEQWSDVATIASAAAALVVLAFAVYQLWGLRKQIKISTHAVEVSRDSVSVADAGVNAARAAVREAARARIDDHSPNLAVLAEPPRWPPHTTNLLSGMPMRNDSRLLDSMIAHGSRSEHPDNYAFPQDGEQLLYFVTEGVVINEGESTARVAINGEAKFVEGTSLLLPGVDLIVPPIVIESDADYLGRQHALRPGQAALFRWAIGRPMKEWAEIHERGRIPSLETHVVALGPAIRDTIKIELSARPLEPVPGRDSQWRVRGESNASVWIHPTERFYLHEDRELSPVREN